ncbi:hypothetical protein ACFVX6_03445 [Streptomyces sp. NPDC058289]|uniref:hypothetical protein n=1 Tax=Streptomyces sp. NPDC058289 TaxID=3346425 RepID=UPI0036E83FD5
MTGIADVPWWIGVFRWVALAGAVPFLLIMQAGIGESDDESVALRVVGGAGPAPGWLMPLGILGFMVAACVAPVLGIYRNFVW